MFLMPENIFKHYNRIVDNKPDRKQKCQQGNDVNRKPERINHRDTTDERHRYCHDWNDRRDERAKKEHDHADYEH